MVDHSEMKLGRLAPPKHMKVTKLGAFLPDEKFPLPEVSDVYKKIENWPMMANDRLGDCTIASAGHTIQLWTTLAQGANVVFTDEQVIAAYSAVTGYDEKDPSSDNGAVEYDVLRYWVHPGFYDHKIVGFMATKLHEDDHYQVKLAIHLFGVVYAGVNLPATAQNQDVWDVVDAKHGDADPGSWGGHAVPLVGYNETGPLCITWGDVKQMTWAWWDKYGEEGYAVLSEDWVNAQKIAPNQVCWDDLAKHLQEDFH